MVGFKYFLCTLVAFHFAESAHLKAKKHLKHVSENDYKYFTIVSSNWPESVQKELAQEYEKIIDHCKDIAYQVQYYVDYLDKRFPNQTINLAIHYEAIAIEESNYILYQYKLSGELFMLTATRFTNATENVIKVKTVPTIQSSALVNDIQIDESSNLTRSQQDQLLKSFRYVHQKYNSPDEQVKQYQLILNSMFPNTANMIVQCYGLVAYTCDWNIGFVIDKTCFVNVWGVPL